MSLPLTREVARVSETEGEKGFIYINALPFLSLSQNNVLTASRLPPRSVLLLRRGVHWTPAPSSEGGIGFYKNMK